MKRLFFATLALILTFNLVNAQTKADYHFKLNLNDVQNDLLLVTLDVPKLKAKTLTYHIPKIVPGTYSIYDFGRFVSKFKALDKNGNELPVEHPDANTWVIKNAKNLSKISYMVEDSWDTKQKEPFVFEPAGTNIEDKTNFVLNNHGFFGYFKGHEQRKYYVSVSKPKNFYGSTGLERKGGDASTDIFYAQNYHYLVDGPIMYCEPDTTWIQVGNCRVLVSVYSPNGIVKSEFLAREIAPTMEAQRKYLGGTLPVDRYAYLIYLNDDAYESGSAGALEHSYSSMYCLFEGEAADIAQTVRDVSAHEFFHIVTPLNIHSEHIHYFDFIEPKMSKHLWMYEGGTEYASHHAQVKGAETTIQHFLEQMAGKMRVADNFDKETPFTDKSVGCLDEFKDQYYDVYQQGALINMALDMKLRYLSKGAYGLQNLMQDLSKMYGKDKPFKDDELFDVIVKLTYPEIRTFIDDHIAGIKPIPFEELLNEFGITYTEEGTVEELSPIGGLENPGAIGVDFALMRLKIEDDALLDAFGRDVIGFKTGDVIMEWDGEDVAMATVNKVIGEYVTSAKEGDEVSVMVQRDEKALELVFKLEKTAKTVKHVLSVNEKADANQLKLRKAWLGDYKSE